MIRPKGLFVVHCHNVWFQLRHRHGVRWFTKSAFQHVIGKSEFGDRVANYRGVNNLFIHSFRKRELRNLLYASGFRRQTWFGVRANEVTPIESPRPWNDLNLVGWIVVCLLYTSPSPRDLSTSRMPSSA